MTQGYNLYGQLGDGGWTNQLRPTAVAVTGTYEVRGETKKRYTNVGTLFQYDDGGFSLMISPTATEGVSEYITLVGVE